MLQTQEAELVLDKVDVQLEEPGDDEALEITDTQAGDAQACIAISTATGSEIRCGQSYK
jgi:hypothetical protein